MHLNLKMKKLFFRTIPWHIKGINYFCKYSRHEHYVHAWNKQQLLKRYYEKSFRI